MSELDIDTQLKQSYLRKEIIEKGHSAEKFSEFLASMKPGNYFSSKLSILSFQDGVNVEVWKIDELKAVNILNVLTLFTDDL